MQDLYCLSAAHQPHHHHHGDEDDDGAGGGGGGGADHYDVGENVDNDTSSEYTCIQASHVDVEGIERPHL